MLQIAIVGCGLQSATIAGYLSAFGEKCAVAAVVDMNESAARQRLTEKKVPLTENCKIYSSLESFMADPPQVQGVIIGTYCNDHTDTACTLETLHVPIWLEKPVAVNLTQWERLIKHFRFSAVPVQISLPMRVSPLISRAKEIIDSGAVGKIHQIIGNEETSGVVYFTTWFRDAEKTGGMFMQKAVHDIDYLLYLADLIPETVCAMREKLWHKGDKPYEQLCCDCPDKMTCPHGPGFAFEKRHMYSSFSEAEKYLSGIYSKEGNFLRPRYCAVSGDIAIEDVGECIFKGTNGPHLIHTQNFIASGAAARRGARVVGDLSTLEIDFKRNRLTLISSVNGSIREITVQPGQFSHYGGDQFLVKNFLETMKTGRRGPTDLITGNGGLSTLCCLCARESADKGTFINIPKFYKSLNNGDQK